MSNQLDLSDQHARFRVLVKSVVERYLENFPDEPHNYWQVACYESIEAFEKTFPNRVACNQMLIKLQEDLKEIERSVDVIIDRVRQSGLTYEDIEFLRYEFPNPDEE